jgi:TorA maturation chaperone TorD
MRMTLREQVIFVGKTLGPLFLEDPKNGAASSLYEAFATLDPEAVAVAWPFVADEMACRFLRQMQEGLAGDPDALLWEFRRLFSIGVTPKPAPPWGSVYTDVEQVVFGASTLELRRWMGANGIAFRSGARAPEDHIGLMLLLMAWIAENRPELLEEYLRLHLLTWSSHFLEELKTCTPHPFFQGLASLTNASLEGLRIQTAIIVEYPRFYR